MSANVIKSLKALPSCMPGAMESYALSSYKDVREIGLYPLMFETHMPTSQSSTVLERQVFQKRTLHIVYIVYCNLHYLKERIIKY